MTKVGSNVVQMLTVKEGEKAFSAFLEQRKVAELKSFFKTFRRWVERREVCSPLVVSLPPRPTPSVCLRGSSHQRVGLVAFK